jgi:hypothetical protein
MDLLFQSDAPRVFENVTQRGSSHARSNVHPIYTLLAYGGVRVLRLVLQLGPVTGAQLFGALVAAVWVTLLYLLLRLTVSAPATREFLPRSAWAAARPSSG